MRELPLNVEGLRSAMRQHGFTVKALASHLHVDVRTVERRFNNQFQTTPKTWITRERMAIAPALLKRGLTNKEVASVLCYSCECNFCRDFKLFYGAAPQTFARKEDRHVSRSDKSLSRFDKRVVLPRA